MSTFIGSISKQYEEQLNESLDAEYVEIISRGNNDINYISCVFKWKTWGSIKSFKRIWI